MEELLYELAHQLFKVDDSPATVALLKKVKKLDKGKYEETISGLDVEDFIGKKPKKKRLNSGVKGKSGEREIVKLFNTRFADLLAKNPNWGEFHRVVGSGNRWSQANLSNRSEEMYSGDILCENLKFVIESKNGYDDVDLTTIFEEGNRELDGFLKQVTDDSNRTGKKPLLIWKKTRKPRLAFLHLDCYQALFPTTMYYKDWTVVLFDKLLELPEDFFFEI